ncbi:methyltransferase domain-containing protein [Shewanella sp. JBTF-M18]|uniref:Methyltransferase domain-containing protein n=1 Tax=Shewanella insulae TaxID=2681496 RepID=A0A6L7HV11_9GAMM|nr:methyltransferase domain-containing protein [Shewanella insulae]MXR67993.1 methyltransferase domain-containing protein [Shewanella insulae]
MNSHYLCPLCQAPLMVHQDSQGLHCANKHHFDKGPQGYWVFSQPKKPHIDSRQLMRAKHFLLESGIFAPVVEAMQRQLGELLPSDATLSHLDVDSGEGYYLRALAGVFNALGQAYEQTGVAEAENALFVAAKAQPEANLIQSQLKTLPFADASFDLVSLFDKPLKGKEPLRVLKPGGTFIWLSPGPRHLWQIREFIYPNLSEKGGEPQQPKGVTLMASERIAYPLALSGEQALTLLEMTPFAWRANDKIKRQIAQQEFAALEIDLYLTLARKDV